MWVVLEEWRVTDRWWTDEPICTSWVEVDCGGRRVIFRQQDGDIWRIHK